MSLRTLDLVVNAVAASIVFHQCTLTSDLSQTIGLHPLSIVAMATADPVVRVVIIATALIVITSVVLLLPEGAKAEELVTATELVLTNNADSYVAVLWHTLNSDSDTVALFNSSDLVVRRFDEKDSTWRSFDWSFVDTLVAGQNFSATSPPLISTNRWFALRMGDTYVVALHMESALRRPEEARARERDEANNRRA
ncbi:hypothetical protein PR202_gb00533 [Eleusine coracana subsp. coracana]|uniref:Dirigent protein n=1 Tax=Eleusine coracana subsp. coracana TaxID=191504 RepID=A0AAV5DTC2_ELECO|nr:hypothetical protein PR202_gb00533 [Eleusine coracana subsp. coracana]